jgi:sec-independent protein translocase protein TatA
MGSLGGFEWLVIILVVLLLFGAKKIPELARGLGQGINEFKRASEDIKKEIDAGKNEANQTKQQDDKTSQTQSGTSS